MFEFFCLFVLNFIFDLFFFTQRTFFPLSSQLTTKKGMVCILSLHLSFYFSLFFRTGKRITCKASNDASSFLSFDHACVKEQLVLVLSSVSGRCL